MPSCLLPPLPTKPANRPGFIHEFRVLYALFPIPGAAYTGKKMHILNGEAFKKGARRLSEFHTESVHLNLSYNGGGSQQKLTIIPRADAP